MTYWPAWAGALALASIAVVHWFLLRRLMSVSSRFTAIVDRARGLGAASAVVAMPAAQPTIVHALFFVGVLLGGAVASVLSGSFAVTASLHASMLDAIVPSGAMRMGVLTLGGVLVGFGTRMSVGCTSGHGLCGVSRFQPGSLVATASFFGAGIVTSFALTMLVRGVS